MQSLIRTVAPTLEPVALADMKTHAIVADAADDDYLSLLLTVAREMFETHTGLALVEQTWQLALPAFSSEIRLPRHPLRSIVSIQYYDASGVLQTLAADQYRVSAAGYVSEAYGKSYPGTESGRVDAVLVTFLAGVYATTGASPDAVDVNQVTNPGGFLSSKYNLAQQAIKILAQHLYENRGLVLTGTILAEYPMSYQAIVDICRQEWF